MTDKQDIFVGSRVDVSFTLNTDSETAGFYDPDYTLVPEVAEFPQLQTTTETTQLETYDDDYASTLSGNKNLDATTLVVSEIVGDPAQTALKNAADTKKLVRFKNVYIIDTGQTSTNSQVQNYIIYDAYVSGYTRTGSNSSVVLTTFTIQPTGAVLASGVAESGEVIRQGDFGVGAGTDEFPGPKDTIAPFGNSWRTYLATATDNPINQNTAIIHSQPNKNAAWQITGSTSGAPQVLIRNLQFDDAGNNSSKSNWVRVITTNNLPKPSDVNAVAITGDTMTGDLKIQKADAMLYLNSATLHGNAAGSLILGSNKQPIIFRPNGDNSTSNQVQIDTDGTLTSPKINLSAQQSQDVSSATRKDYVDSESNKRVLKSGDTMTGALITPRVISDTIRLNGAGSTVTPDVAGAYISYGIKGSTASDFVTHKGTGSGGFNFWNGDSTNIDKVFGIDGSGRISFSGGDSTGVINVVSGGVNLSNNVNLTGLDSNNNSVRVAGITTDNKVAVGSSSNDFVIISSSNPVVRKGSTDYPIYSTGNKPSPSEIGAIALNAVVDFGYMK